jgi:hypothetical protein
VVIAVFGVPCSPIFSALVVVVAAAYALVMAASKNKSSIARLPRPLGLLVDVATALLRVAAAGVDRFSDILKSSVHGWLALGESGCNGNCRVKKTLNRMRFCGFREGAAASFMSFSLRADRARGSSRAIRGMTVFLDDAQNADYTYPEVLCAA